MRKFMGILFLVLAVATAATVYAADNDSVLVKVTVLASLGVDIAETELQLGSVDAGSSVQSASGITVTNTGSGVAETYSLSLTDPVTWSAASAPGVETYVLSAAFDSDGSLAWDPANHALSTAPVAAGASQFAGDETGVSVPYNETRALWFEFQAPTATGVTAEQGITVTVTAQIS